jgi:hypothetical protein
LAGGHVQISKVADQTIGHIGGAGGETGVEFRDTDAARAEIVLFLRELFDQ